MKQNTVNSQVLALLLDLEYEQAKRVCGPSPSNSLEAFLAQRVCGSKHYAGHGLVPAKDVDLVNAIMFCRVATEMRAWIPS